MNVISKNSKTGYSINFPIKSTCDKACPFYVDRTCYGLKGRFLFPNVKQSNEARYVLYRVSPDEYFATLRAELLKLSNKGVTHIRINGIGDTPDARWAVRFAALTFDFPELHFWVATRKLFWKTVDVPENVVVRFSEGIDGDLTSNVTDNVSEATCPATDKNSGIHTCAECDHWCWSKDVKNVKYAKH